MKPRFGIGDYVEVRATVQTGRTYKSGGESGDSGGDRRCYKKLYRTELKEPLRGWIVGAARRFEGVVKGDTHPNTDCPPYLETTDSKLVWKIAQSMMNVPVEAFDEDVTLVKIGEYIVRPQTPMRLGSDAQWDDEEKNAQRERMEKIPRDAKGHWLKETKL